MIAPTVAPRIVRSLCPQCSGRGLVMASTYRLPPLHIEPCSQCAAQGYVLTETPQKEIAP